MERGKVILLSDDFELNTYIIRGLRVVMDFDVARLYGVTPKELRGKLRYHKKRFPSDFAFKLTKDEYCDCVSRFNIAKTEAGKTPFVLTETGIYMVSSVIKTKQAAIVSVKIVRGLFEMFEY